MSTADDFLRGVNRGDSGEQSQSGLGPGPGDAGSGFERLQAEAATLAANLRGSVPATATYTGWDDAETISVTIDADGAITAVELPDSAHDRTKAHLLAAAVVQATRNAGLDRLRGWAVSTGTPHPSVVADAPPASPSPAPTVAAGDLTGRRLLDLVHGVTAELDAFAQRAQQQATRRVAARSGGKHVRAIYVGDQLSQVEIDVRWAARARATEVSLEIADAVRKAQKSAANSAPDPSNVGPSFTELQRIAAGFQAIVQDPKRRGH